MKRIEKITSLVRRIILKHPESLLQKPLRLLRAIKRNPIKQFSIKMRLKKLLRENYLESAKKLILFVTTDVDMVNGGIRSFCSHYEETRKIGHIHGSEVVMCTGPDEKLLLKYTKFKNNNYIFGFSQILSYFRNLESLMIHVPEYMVSGFLREISKKDYFRLEKIINLHINILLQNMQGLPSLQSINGMKKLGKITCTTAHQRYSTLELRRKIGIPLHMLSVLGGPELYTRKKYVEKENLMIVSPDEHPRKSEVLSLIGRGVPKVKIRIIKNLTYEEYRKIIERAKWALTFGEGLDGYFVETIFSGGISFSVYNPVYFTEDYRSLRTVYETYDLLVERICSDLKNLDDEAAYGDYQVEQYGICSKDYISTEYRKNLELFYKGSYTYK